MPDPGVQDRRSAALAAAVVSRLNLTVLLMAYAIPIELLPILLTLPGPVEHAVNEHTTSIEAVAQLLAAEHGVQHWAALPLEDKLRFQREAFELVENTPVPVLARSSTAP